MNHPNFRARAFTIIELLLATTLATVLMGIVMIALAAISKDRARLAATESPSRAASEALIDLVRRDLIHARRIWTTPRDAELILTGYGALDPETLTPTGRLVRVTYAIDGQGRLLRWQDALDDRTTRSWSELVAYGATRLHVSLVKARSEAGSTTAPAQLPVSAAEDRNNSRRNELPRSQKPGTRATLRIAFAKRPELKEELWIK